MKKIIYLLPIFLACEKETLPPEPTFTSLEITELRPYSANLKTTIKHVGDAEDLGFAYGTDSSAFKILSLHPLNEKELSTEVEGLLASTQYFVKSFIKIRGKVHYSPSKSFTTPAPEGLVLITAPASDIAYSGAKLQGEISVAGNLKIAEYGLEWGKNELAEPLSRYSLTAASPTYPLTFQYFAGNLEPSTTYHFRSYVKSGDQTYYGSMLSFTTGEHYFPLLHTGDFQTTENSATVSGSLDKKGSHPIGEYGIVMSTLENPTTLDVKKSLVTEPKNYPAKFNFEVKELLPATTYHYRTYAIMNGVTTYGANRTFTTGMVIPTIITLNASQLSIEGAQLNARLEAAGTFAPTEIGVVYGHSAEEPNRKLKFQTYDIPTPFQYNVGIQGLMDNQTYHYRAYVLTKGQMYYGEVRKFTTLKATPITAVTSDKTVNLGLNGLRVQADVHPGSYVITEHGFQYAYNEGGPALKIMVPKKESNPYKIEATIPYPGCAKEIYFRAYALGKNGYTVYGEKRKAITAAC